MSGVLAPAVVAITRELDAVALDLERAAYRIRRAAGAANRGDGAVLVDPLPADLGGAWARAAKRTVALEDALARFGRHREGCAALVFGQCTCEWEDVRQQLLVPDEGERR